MFNIAIILLFAATVTTHAGKIQKSNRVVNAKLKENDTGDGWHEWHHAFNLADQDNNNKLSLGKMIAILFLCRLFKQY